MTITHAKCIPQELTRLDWPVQTCYRHLPADHLKATLAFPTIEKADRTSSLEY